jgi:hypothetical protein
VQIAHKQKLTINWNVGADGVEKLKQLAIQDGYATPTLRLCVHFVLVYSLSAHSGSCSSKSSLSWHRMYSMRIENRKARAPEDTEPYSVLEGTSQFSVPARCFEASLQAPHRMDMHLSFSDTMLGFQWRYHRDLDCTIENRKDMPSWPRQSDVVLLLPQVSPGGLAPMWDGTSAV